MWTLWIGIDASTVHPVNGFGVGALKQLCNGVPLRTRTGLQLQAIKKDGIILGYGLVHKQIPKGSSVTVTDMQLAGLTASITEAFERHGIRGPVKVNTGYTESPLLLPIG